MAEIYEMMEGWQRRYERMEDLFITWAAYPQYQVANPKKCPPLKKFFAHRKKESNAEENEQIRQEIIKEFDL